ncbi:MAG: glycosyltransferase family 2 protein [Deltaproteobacteria bacterium]|nr:glycosyltransferase family 2 protein [Deltaproteobacteria bacterium]
MSVCIVIPAFNEERSIADVVTRSLRSGMDVVVVDDGSADATARLAEQAGAQVERHSRNQGKGVAIRTAAAWVLARGYDAAIFLDADGQHLPEELARFQECFENTGADLIVGTRMADNASMPLVRKIANRSSSLMVSLVAGTRVTDSQSGYRLFSRRMLERLRTHGGVGFDFESEMIIDAVRDGLTYREIPISCIYGEEKSHYRPFRDAAQFLLLIARKSLERLRPRLRR